MNFRQTAAQFFRNVADYFEPQPKSFAVVNDEKFDFSIFETKQNGSIPKEPLINSYALSTVTDPTNYNNTVAYFRENHEEFEKIVEQLKAKNSEPIF